MDSGAIFMKDQCPKTPINALYQEACGSVLWAAMVICPDILCTIRILSHFITNPAEVYWNALKCVIKYLYTTKDLWLKFGGHDQTLEGYTDADWAFQPHRHFISDYAFI
jgi:hypothetical protein